jgi:SAM-dependent methyltransferase
MDTFYDEMAPHYHLLFEDWDASIEHQGTALGRIIRERWPNHQVVLDVACGIGTQAIGLAANGFKVTASDVSVAAVERAKFESQRRNQSIGFSACDMREAFSRHGGGFDLVVCCDNSIPHLLTDAEISLTLKQMFDCLRPGGGCLLTVRDYDREPRGENIVKVIRAATRDDVRSVVFQVWDFEDELYDLTMFIVEEVVATRTVSTRALRTRYYAIGIPRLISLMREAGFRGIGRIDDVFYQPVLVGTRSLEEGSER